MTAGQEPAPELDGDWPGWRADSRWPCIDLLSDVHLQASMPRTFAAWRDHLLHTPAPAVLMLGDLFEVWVGDDARTVGFEAECLAVLQQAARRLTLAFMPGNRDFLLGPAMAAEVPMTRLTDPTVLLAFGQRWLLSHGDALCLNDTAYQRFRAQVRGPDWQQAFLAQPLVERQQQARAMRDASVLHQAGLPAEVHGEVDATAAAHWLRDAACPVLIHGHTHRPGLHDLPDGGQRHVLGDWDLDAPPRRARILRLSASGLQSLDLAECSAG